MIAVILGSLARKVNLVLRDWLAVLEAMVERAKKVYLERLDRE